MIQIFEEKKSCNYRIDCKGQVTKTHARFDKKCFRRTLAPSNEISMSSLNTKLETLPKNLKQEVLDFIDFLLEKSAKSKKKVIPQFGTAKGKIKMSADFDEPLDDFKDYI